ncbi:MAG: helix-turn-helix domain-containing protein, partial [Colwellia sp.]|nr:helix-turn-helix domain-containing protein [Colwellia sp.]
HHCILAGSGELGLQLAQEYIPDLIVCDLMLTGIDGFEVLTQLKQDEMTAHIPVILLTARSDLESRLQGLNLNADEYLSKPFNQHELLTRIQSLITNRQQLQKRYLRKFNDEQKAERKTTSQKNVAKLTQDPTEQSSLDDKFLHKLEALIAKHYTDPELDISLLAKELAMSERQLQRKIKMILGTTPNNFIKEFRLKKAQELLLSGSQIGRIALDVGFSSQTYFGRCFKESFDCTPKQYQQRIAQQDSSAN